MRTIKILSLSLLVFLGGCMFVYGGYDDSPGGQLLGAVMALAGSLALRKAA